jgi:hypothetical protein
MTLKKMYAIVGALAALVGMVAALCVGIAYVTTTRQMVEDQKIQMDEMRNDFQNKINATWNRSTTRYEGDQP